MTMEKQIDLLDQARSDFAIELLQTQTKLDHARQDLNDMTLDRNHVKGELDFVSGEFGKLLTWANKPTATIGTQTSLTAEQVNNAFQLIKEQKKDLEEKEKTNKDLKNLIDKERGERAEEKAQLEAQINQNNLTINNLKGDIANKEQQLTLLRQKLKTLRDQKTELEKDKEKNKEQIAKLENDIKEQEAKVKDLEPNDTEKQLLVYVDWKNWKDEELEKIKGELETGKTPFSQWNFSLLRGDYVNIRSKLLEVVNSLIDKEQEAKEQARKEGESWKEKFKRLDQVLKEKVSEIFNLIKFIKKKAGKLLEDVAKLDDEEKKKLEEIILFDDWKTYLKVDTLEQFANLKTLYCSSTQIKELPTLPNSLTTLYCSSTQIKELPTLPQNISYINIHGNLQLERLPTLTPNLNTLHFYSSPKLVNVELNISNLPLAVNNTGLAN